MADNYADVLRQVRAGGLLVSDLEVCGRIRRCKVDGIRGDKGWYILHEIRTDDGRDLIVGSWGYWQDNDSHAQKIELTKADRLTPEQSKAIRDRVRADRRRAAQMRAAEVAQAQRRAETIWRKSLVDPPAGVPDYLTRKGIGAHDVRYTPSGAMVVPMGLPDGRIRALQFILDRKAHARRIAQTGVDKEFWPKGCSTTSCYHLIGSPAAILLLAEGYATAASLHEATGLTVAVAFNANNLVPVAEGLRKRYPAARILVCADDDFATKGNPGVTAASAAALVGGGAWVAPVFLVPDQVEIRARIGAEIDWSAEGYKAAVGDILRGRRKLTDFNDLHQAEGLLLVRAQIEGRIDALGWGKTVSAARHPTTTGGGGAVLDWTFTLDVLQDHYTLIYSTDTVFDARRHRVLGLGPLRSAAGKGLVRTWLEHPDRRVCLPEAVGFDPQGTDPAVHCNLWSGWPTVPRAGSCARLLELLEYLCNGNPGQQVELFDWVLRWVAYPIQHPGAKMASSILMHGPEGTGKNTFFGALRQIYAHYACQFSQVELESQFNGWASGKLFAIGNEVVSRAELYHIQGRLKSMVTEPEWIINEKMLPARSEANHCNFVFFSNRIDIAKLDAGDRRYCVIWTPAALPPEFYQEVADEIAAGGVAALHHHLLHLDLGDFNPHTKPPMTQAKEDLVELGMDSTDRFFRDWIKGEIDVPAVVCLSDDLYSVYRLWCQREGINKSAQKQTLLTAIGKKTGVRKCQERYLHNNVVEKRTVIYAPGYAAGPGDGANRQVWIGQHVSDFAGALLQYREASK